MFIPEFVKRTKVEVIVLDEEIQDITNSIKNDQTIRGKLAVSEVIEYSDL